MQEIKVKNIIISKQFEVSENYKKFLKIVKEKNIKVKVVHAGERIQIEKNLYIDILWPDISNPINDNILNNNALVFKLSYISFSILFTGDIEEIAEKMILEKYKNNLELLKVDVLKVAHHGSATSSIEEFLNVVRPEIALIGVSEDNSFGHPSDNVLERLENFKCKIYRTDENGEISIEVKANKLLITPFMTDN